MDTPVTKHIGPLGSTVHVLHADAGTIAELAAIDWNRHFRRVCLDPVRGVITLMAPSHPHEDLSEILDQIVSAAGSVITGAAKGIRSTRLRGRGEPPGTGMEPDCAFYVGERARVVGAAGGVPRSARREPAAPARCFGGAGRTDAGRCVRGGGKGGGQPDARRTDGGRGPHRAPTPTAGERAGARGSGDLLRPIVEPRCGRRGPRCRRPHSRRVGRTRRRLGAGEDVDGPGISSRLCRAGAGDALGATRDAGRRVSRFGRRRPATRRACGGGCLARLSLQE